MSFRDGVIFLELLAISLNLFAGMYVYRQHREDPRNVHFFAITCCFVFLCVFELKGIIAPSDRLFRWLPFTAVPVFFLPGFVFALLASQERRFREGPGWLHFAPLAPGVLLTALLVRCLRDLPARLAAIPVGHVWLVDTGGVASLLILLYVPIFLAGFAPLAWTVESRPFARAFAAAISLPVFLLLSGAYLAALPFYLAGRSFEFVYLPGLLPATALVAGLLAFAVALRHRSLDVEEIANRTLVFSAVTIVLSGLYVVIENLLQSFFAGILSTSNKLFEMIAALIIAAFFGEVQSRVADLVDRLFNFLRGGALLSRTGAREGVAKAVGTLAAVYFAVLLVGRIGLPVGGRLGYLLSGATLAGAYLYLLVSLYRLEFDYLFYAVVTVVAAALHAGIVTFAPPGTDLHPYLNVLSVLLLAMAAFSLGRIIAARIDELAVLLPLLLLASTLDIWSVFRGVTGEMIASKSTTLDYLLVEWPALHHTGVAPYIGVADLLFASILFGVALAYNLGGSRNLLVLAGGYIVTFLTVAVTRQGVPALPFLSLGFILANFRRLELRKRDFWTMFGVLVGAIAVFSFVRYLRVFAGK